MSAVGSTGRLTPAQIAQLRRWAKRVAENGTDERLKAATRAIARLADEAERLREPARAEGPWAWSDAAGPDASRPNGEQVARARRWAQEMVANGAPGEPKAAAKAILLLCDDVASFRGETAPAAARAPAARAARRGGPPLLRLRPPVLALAEWRRTHPLAVLASLVPVALVALFFVAARTISPDLDPRGPSAGALVGAEALTQLELSILGDHGRLDKARWTLDGEDVTARAILAGDRIVLRPRRLADGDHHLEVRISGLMLWSAGGADWSFTVDTAAPEIQVTKGSLQAPVRSPYRLEGAVDSAASVTVGGAPVALVDGRFAVAYDTPPTEEIAIVAHDAAGNASRALLTVVLVPRRPAAPARAVHVSAAAWASDDLRAGVLALIEQKKINAVELDLKDESGVIGWDAPVALGRKIGAVREIYDLKAAVELLHGKGVRVIGRLVAFRDPILAEWAWKAKKRGLVIQTPDGSAYSGGYGGFTNFADDTVRQYNVDVAVAAAELGVDEILYDYVRRPDGPLGSMVFPGFTGNPGKPIVSFLADTRQALRPYGTFLGASVFGIAVTRPDEIGQDIPLMARQVDYIAPMLYPSHWGPYEYELPNPVAQPYDIVFRSLEDYREAVEGTGARVVPWLQDFSLGVDYGPAEVRAQVEAAQDAGIDEFLLWDPAVTYTGAALKANARFPATGTAKAAAGSEELVALPSAPASSSATVDSGLEPNELGVVPVLMYHQILPGGGGEYDLTPEEFRAELQRLYDEGYRPITASDYVNGAIDLPRGATPVVMTFDDSTATQAALTGDGSIEPSTAVGIMLDFAEAHPGFEPAATFYVNANLFGAGGDAGELAAWLTGHGFELGNHTPDHTNLGELGASEVQQRLVLGNRVIHELLPDAKVETMALPFGVMPDDAKLARKGSWDGESYAFKGVMLVGAEPAPSPFSSAFRPGGVPRIRSFPTPDLEAGSADWLDRLAGNPELRYVSDGDAKRVTFPAGRAGELAERYASQARQY